MSGRIFVVVLFMCLCVSSLTIAADVGSYDEIGLQPPAEDSGELLIDFSNDDTPSAIAGFLSRAGVTPSQYSLFSQDEKWVKVQRATDRLVQLLHSASDVEDVEPNYYYTALAGPNDPYYKYQWHLDQIGMPRAWDYPAGAPVTVAVIDTGIAYEQYRNRFRVEDLGDSQFVKPWNFIDGTEHANDDHGHGTHVAGTIAQLTNNGVGVAGVAPAVRLMPLKVLNASGYGTLSDIAAAIRYAADNGAQVINMSLGGPFPSRILHKAVQYAHDKGVVVVCAAGNSGRGRMGYPAAYEEAISVSAVRYDGQLTWYSSYGRGLTIAAPGGDMRVDQNGDGLMDGVLQNTINPQDTAQQGYFLFQGTSMAAPHVAAVAALLVSQGVTDPEQVRDYLMNSATKVKGKPEEYGAGIVNAAEALRSAFLKRKIKLAAFALVLLIAFLAALNRRRGPGEKVRLNALAITGLILGSTGFFFVGFLPLAHRLFYLSHAVNEWALGIGGPSLFANPLILSALPAALLVMACYPWKRLIPLAVAFGVAAAAYLFAQAIFPTTGISWIPGRLLESGWLILNGLLSLVFAAAASFRLK